MSEFSFAPLDPFMPQRHAPLVRWLWTDAPHAETALAQLRALREMGCGGVVLTAPPDRASAVPENWPQVLRAFVEECRRLQLRVWLEQEAPSAFAIPASEFSAFAAARSEPPEAMIAHAIEFHVEDVAANQAAHWPLPNWRGDLLCAVAVPLDGAPLADVGRAPDWSRAVSLTTADAPQRAALLAALETDARVYLWTPVRDDENGALDPMHLGATSLLLQHLEHQWPLRDASETQGSVGAHSAGAAAIYLRPPGLWSGGHSAADGLLSAPRFPWSLHLPNAFLAQHGYDLIERLPSLIADTGPDAARVRQDFWTTVVDLLQRNFWTPCCEQLQARGWTTTGAVISHSSLQRITAECGDAVVGLSSLTVPGVAASSERSGGLHARLCASLAALEGRTSALAQMEIAGWDATPQAQLPALHHLMQQGIFAFVAAPARSSLHCDNIPRVANGIGHEAVSEAAREAGTQADTQADTPSLLHQPYGARFQTFADYLARCGEALSRGRSAARVGLLWPQRSAWAHHNPKGHRFVRWVEEDLQATASLLDELHYSFLLLPEDTLCAARCEVGFRVSGVGSEIETNEASGDEVEGAPTPEAPGPKPDTRNPRPDAARLLCGAAQMSLEMIVLPSVTALSWAAWRKLEEFIEAGGKVVCLGLLPRWSERGRDEELEQHIGRTTRLTVADAYEAYNLSERAGTAAQSARRAAELAAFAAAGLDGDDMVGGALPPITEFVGYPIAREYRSGGRLSCYQPRLNRDVADARLRASQILRESLPPDLETQSPHILHTRRIVRPAHAQTNGGTDACTDEGTDTSANGEMLFVFNANEAAQHVHLRIYATRAGSGCAPHLLDAWTGDSRPLPVWMPFPHEEGGGLSLTLDMAAHQANLLWIAHVESAPPHAEHANFFVETLQAENGAASSAMGQVTAGSNPESAHEEAAENTTGATADDSVANGESFSDATAEVPSVPLVARGHAVQAVTPAVALRRAGKSLWFSGAAVEVPAPLLLPDEWKAQRTGPNVFVLDDWSRNSSGQWRAEFRVEGPPQPLFLAMRSRRSPAVIRLNEQRLTSCDTPFPDEILWRDAAWQWFDLASGAVRRGLNELVIEPVSSESSGFDNGRLIGDFSLREEGSFWSGTDSDEAGGDGGAEIASPALTQTEPMVLSAGSWHEQGLPFYAGQVEFSQQVEAPPDWGNCRVFLEVSRARDVIEAWMNGVCAGVRVAAPYRFDVTSALRFEGENEVVLKIWNSAEAALARSGTTPASSGILGPVRLVAYPLVEIKSS